MSPFESIEWHLFFLQVGWLSDTTHEAWYKKMASASFFNFQTTPSDLADDPDHKNVTNIDYHRQNRYITTVDKYNLRNYKRSHVHSVFYSTNSMNSSVTAYDLDDYVTCGDLECWGTCCYQNKCCYCLASSLMVTRKNLVIVEYVNESSWN